VHNVNIRWFVAMPKDERLNSAMGKVSKLEKNYDWLGAAELCKKALNLVSDTDFLNRSIKNPISIVEWMLLRPLVFDFSSS